MTTTPVMRCKAQDHWPSRPRYRGPSSPARRAIRRCATCASDYLATGRSWHLSVPSKSKVLLEAFLEEVGQVSVLDLDTARLGLRLSPDDMAEFRERLEELLYEFSQRPDVPDAPPWSVFYAIHPDVSRVKRAG